MQQDNNNKKRIKIHLYPFPRLSLFRIETLVSDTGSDKKLGTTSSHRWAAGPSNSSSSSSSTVIIVIMLIGVRRRAYGKGVTHTLFTPKLHAKTGCVPGLWVVLHSMVPCRDENEVENVHYLTRIDTGILPSSPLLLLVPLWNRDCGSVLWDEFKNDDMSLLHVGVRVSWFRSGDEF